MDSSVGKRIAGIQYCRAFAAIAVILYHLGTTFTALEQKSVLTFVFKHGHLGVDFFFVLSGFIIYRAHFKDFGIREKAILYAKKRFFRIYPIFFIIVTTKIIILFILGIELKEEQKSIDYFVSSFFLLPIEGQFPLLSVSWTLCHEVTFYLFFMFSMLAGKKFFVFSTLIWTLIIVFYNLNHIESNFLINHLFSPYNIEFIVGIGIALVHEKKFKAPKLLFFLLATTLILISMNMKDSLFFRLTLGGAFGILILFSINLPHFSSSVSKITRKVFMVTGNASYSIYLIHTLIITATYKILIGILDLNLIGFIAFFASWAVGVLLWKFVEDPLLQFSKKRFILNQ